MQYQSHDTYGQKQYEDSLQSSTVVAESSPRSVVQKSLFEVFNEFSILISGEIKTQSERDQGKNELNIQA